MSEVEFRAVISAEELKQMVKEHVARSIRGHRSSIDEDGNPVDWEENLVGPLIKNEVKAQVTEALAGHLESTIAAVVKEGLADGFLLRTPGSWGGRGQEERLSLRDFVVRHLTTRTRESGRGLNAPELTTPERVMGEVLERALREDFAKVLEELRVTFKTALTAKFTEAAAEALKRAVGL
jgi:hypothetical protein